MNILRVQLKDGSIMDLHNVIYMIGLDSRETDKDFLTDQVQPRHQAFRIGVCDNEWFFIRRLSSDVVVAKEEPVGGIGSLVPRRTVPENES